MRGALEATPFITFYPAIVASPLQRGVWTGIAGIALSSAAAHSLFLPHVSAFSAAPEAVVPLLVYVLVTFMLETFVTLLNTALDRLAQAAEHSRFMLETEPAGIIAVDNEGTIELVNTAAERQLGYTR